MPNQDPLNPLQEQNIQSGTPVTNQQWANQGTPVSDQMWKILSKTESTPNLGTKTAIPYNELDTTGRYPSQAVGMDNEDLYGNAQSGWSRLKNSTLKTAGLASTTFLNGTAGLVYGLYKSLDDGKMSSIYDNDFTRSLDDWNAQQENNLAFYKTNAETNQDWFSPGSYLTQNFWLDGVLKNSGFMAGAALSGGVYASALKALPLTAKLFSIGKSAEILAATEESMLTGKTAEAIGKVKSLSDKFLGEFDVLNKGGRAVVSTLGATGEAGMEAYNNKKEFQDALIKQYTQKNGVAPEGEELKKIQQYGDGVGNLSFALNIGLLTATNYVQFPKILGSSYELEKSELNNIINTNPIIKDAESGLYKSALPEKGIAKRLVQAKNIGELLFAPSEAFEEGAQYAIQTGTQNYYNKKYDNKPTDFLEDMLGYGIKQSLTTNEGILNIMSGGISGGIMMSGAVGIKGGKPVIGKTGNIAERGITGYGGELGANTEEAVKAFNTNGLSKFTKDGIDAVNRGAVLQQEREAAIRQGDVLEARDLEYDYTHNYLVPRIKYNRFDLVNSEIEDYRKLAGSQEGFSQLQDQGIASQEDTQIRFMRRLDNLQSHASNLNSLYQSLNVRYSGALNEKGDRVYSDTVIDKMAYAASKVADYDKRIPELQQSLISSGINISPVVDQVSKKNVEGLATALQEIDNLNILSDKKDEYKQQLMDLAEISARRQKFLEEYDNIKKNPNTFGDKEPQVTPEDLSGKTFTQSKQKEYTSRKADDDTYNVVSPTGEVISNHSTKDDADGVRDSENLKLPPKEDKITVVRKTDAGLYEVKDSSGKTYYLSPDMLQNYTPVKTQQDIVKEREDFNKQVYAEINNSNAKNATTFSFDTAEAGVYVGTDPKKSINMVFRGTTYNVKYQRDYIGRQQYFLSNIHKLPNPEEIKVMLVTPNNAEGLGLSGLYDYLLNTPELKAEYPSTNTNKFPLVQVYVRDIKGKRAYISATGESIGEVGQTIDYNNVVFGVMPTADPSYRTPTNDGKFEQRYLVEKTTPEEVSLYLNSYIKDREEIAKWTGDQTEVFDFGVTRGTAIHNENYLPNSAVGSLITKEDLDNQDIIKVSDGSIINYEGEDITFKAGVPYIKNGSTIQPLKNEVFSKEKIDLLYKILSSYTEEYNKKGKDALKIQRLENYLQGVLYFSVPKDNAGTNQIWLDEGGMFHFSTSGEVPFTKESFIEQEANIKDYLSKMYHITNNKYVKLEEPFEEITDITDTIQSIQWKTYRHYLLSDTYDLTRDDNSPLKNKSREFIPLTTSVRKLSPETPLDTNYYYKFSVIRPSSSSGLFSVSSPKVSKPKASGLAIPKGDAAAGLAALGQLMNLSSETPEEIEWQKTNIPGNRSIEFGLNADNEVVIKDNSFTTTDGTAHKFSNEELNFFIGKINEQINGQPTVQQETKAQSLLATLKLKNKDDISKLPKMDYGEEAYRVITNNFNYTISNIQEEKEYIEGVLNISVHRVENLIKTTSGGYAFGMFKDAAIYLYQGAEKGTGYHEAFEAVYSMYTTPTERAKLLNEFKSRSGSFVDRMSALPVNYSSATDFQAKEQLAEEFRDFVLNKPAPSTGILKFFKGLLNFIKNLLSGNTIQNLFNRIDSGYYKTAAPYTSFSPAQYREIPQVTAKQRHSVINGIVSAVFQKVFKEQVNLTDFDEPDYNIQKLYDSVYNELNDMFASEKFSNTIPNLYSQELITDSQYEQYASLWENIQSNWGAVTELVNQKLRTYDIIANLTGEDVNDLIEQNEVTDKESEVTFYEGGRNADSYVQDSFKYDFKKNASTSVKLLISTLVETTFNEDGSKAIPQLDADTHMQKMVNYSKTFNQLMQNLYSLNTFEEKSAAIQKLATKYSNYLPLANRLKLSYENLTVEDWKLRTKFFNVTSKQRPDSFITYLQGNNIYTESANLNTLSRNYVDSWLSKLKEGSTGIINKSPEGVYVFNGDKLKGFTFNTVNSQIDFLNAMQIPFTREMFDGLSAKQKTQFTENTKALHKYLSKKLNVTDISSQTLDASNNFSKIAELYIAATGENYESTLFNMEGERVQQYPQNNYISVINNDINNSTTLEELLSKSPQFGNVYTNDSVYLNDILFEGGKRTGRKLNTGYTQGFFDKFKSKALPNSRLSYSDRVLLELNQNLNKNYYILVPADSKTEWMLSMEHIISYKELSTPQGISKLNRIFNTYYQTERLLHSQNKAYKGLMYDITNSYESPELSEDDINNYISQRATELKQFLKNNNKIEEVGEDSFRLKNIDTKFLQANGLSGELTDQQLDSFFKFTEVNYIINNIEIHKLYFGEPSVIKDPLKRYKSFMSGRETSINSTPQVNNILNKDYNKAGNIELTLDDYGYHTHKDYMNTVVFTDAKGIELSIYDDEHLPANISKEYLDIDGADAQSWATYPAVREILYKSGKWSNQQEALYQYTISNDRLLLEEDGKYMYSNPLLKKHDEVTIKGGIPNTSTIPVIKPIGSGYMNDNNLFLHKTSLFPISYSAVRGTNLADHYLQMINNGISYIIVKSGAKIGAKETTDFYTAEGEVNISGYKKIDQIPFKYYGIQVETSTQKDKNTLGTQLSKLATVNLISEGKPLTEEVGQKIARNTNALKNLQSEGYNKLLDVFGITDNNGSYTIQSKDKVLKLIKSELFRRDAPENVRDMIRLDEQGDFVTPLEALSNYDQIKSILYSYVDKLIAKPKLNGAPQIQVSGTLWEKGVRQVKDINGKSYYISSGLKFYSAEYKDGVRTNVNRMEVMLPMWFADQLKSSPFFKDNTDQEILDYINKTSPDILNGVGFRIPTQDANSTESFTVVGFIPRQYGNTVVVPEAITKKAGSDFDVDKLSTYLKNIYITHNGEIKSVPYFGVGQEAKDKLRDLLDKIDDTLVEELASAPKKYIASLDKLENLLDTFESQVDKMYYQSLENEYFDSLQELILEPLNYERLITPNSSKELVDLRNELHKIAPEEFNNSNTSKVLTSRMQMSGVRHANLVAKGGVGIAAVQQTNNALNQLDNIYLTPENIGRMAKWQKDYVKNIDILLPHNTININGKELSTLSKSTDTEGKVISDKISQYINGYVDITKDAFISDLGATTQVASTFIILEKFGVPTDTVVYFMNQPIIREFLKNLSRNNQTWLYNSDYISQAKDLFPEKANLKLTQFKATDLKSTIEKYYNGKKLTAKEQTEQRIILDEFLKYTIFASHLYDIHRGISYDTDASGDPNMNLRKIEYTNRSINNNLFTSAKALLSKSFLGNTARNVYKGSKAISQTLTIIDQPEIRQYTDKVLADVLLLNKGADDYQKIARSVEQSLITHAIQTDKQINQRAKELLTDATKSIATRVNKMRTVLADKPDSDLANNLIINQLVTFTRSNTNQAKIVTLLTKPKSPEDVDAYADSFREMRSNPLTADLYNDLVQFSFLQSGISRSPISFMEYIPSEDFTAITKEVILKMRTLPLDNWVELDSFFRNSWKNTTAVPNFDEKVEEDYYIKYKNRRMPEWWKSLLKKNRIASDLYTPFIVSEKSGNSRSKFLTVNLYKPKQDSPKTILLKRLDNELGVPIATPYSTDPTFGDYYMYIPINAWGDGFYAQEYYNSPRPSALNNGTYATDTEIPFSEILEAYNNKGKKNKVSSEAEMINTSEQEINKVINQKDQGCK